MAGVAGLGLDEFRDRYWRHRPAYDRGLHAEEYWGRVLETTPSVDALSSLRRADAESWTDYRDDMWALTAEFRASGGRTAFLSNGIPDVMALVRTQRVLPDYFDVVLVSCEIGITKPDPRIYRECLRRLGCDAGEALFADDRPANVDGALRLGIRSITFTGDASVAELRRMLELA